jgi:hypothetical protein
MTLQDLSFRPGTGVQLAIRSRFGKPVNDERVERSDPAPPFWVMLELSLSSTFPFCLAKIMKSLSFATTIFTVMVAFGPSRTFMVPGLIVKVYLNSHIKDCDHYYFWIFSLVDYYIMGFYYYILKQLLNGFWFFLIITSRSCSRIVLCFLMTLNSAICHQGILYEGFLRDSYIIHVHISTNGTFFYSEVHVCWPCMIQPNQRTGLHNGYTN